MLIELAWTEPFVILFLAATVFCAVRWPKGLPWAFGLFLASKQYTIFALPLGVLLLPRPIWRRESLNFLGKSFAIAAAVTLPLVVWNVSAFWHSAVALQLQQPLRDDALSWLIQLYQNGHQEWAQRLTWTAYPAALVAIGLVLGVGHRRPAGFAAGLAVTYLAFFGTNKQAFCNYYFLVIAAAACALAALSSQNALYPLPIKEDTASAAHH
jgi:hypothetical protein